MSKDKQPLHVKQTRGNSKYTGTYAPSAEDLRKFLEGVPDYAAVTVHVPEWGWPRFDYTLTATWRAY